VQQNAAGNFAFVFRLAGPNKRSEVQSKEDSLYCTRMSGSQIAQRDRRDEMVMRV